MQRPATTWPWADFLHQLMRDYLDFAVSLPPGARWGMAALAFAWAGLVLCLMVDLMRMRRGRA